MLTQKPQPLQKQRVVLLKNGGGGNRTHLPSASNNAPVQKLERAIDKRDLMIVDELGYVPLGQGAAENLFGFFFQCYERTSLIVTTNVLLVNGHRSSATSG